MPTYLLKYFKLPENKVSLVGNKINITIIPMWHQPYGIIDNFSYDGFIFNVFPQQCSSIWLVDSLFSLFYGVRYFFRGRFFKNTIM